MPNLDLDQAFGQLRSLFATGTPPIKPLLPLLKKAQRANPSRFEQEWLPYLERQPLPTLKISALDSVKPHLDYLPKTMPLHLLTTAQRFSLAQAKELAAHPIAAQINQLSSINIIEPGAIAALVTSAHAPALKCLFIEGTARVSAADITALCESECIRPLRSIYASHPNEKRRFDPILNSPKLTNLEHLTWLAPSLPALATLEALLAQSKLSSLRSNIFDDQAMRCFEGITSASSLHALSLQCEMSFTQSMFKALSASQWHNLEYLHLFGTSIDAVGLKVLLDSPTVASLRGLRFERVSLEPAALALLAQTDALRGLRELRLSNEPPTPAQLQSLLSAKTLPALETLELHQANASGPELARALSQLEDAPKVKVLELSHCELTDEDVIQLVAAPWLQQVQVLNLEGNNLNGDFIQRAFLDRELLPNLTSLELARNPLNTSAAPAIEQLLKARPSLRLVDLRGAPLAPLVTSLDQHPVRLITKGNPIYQLRAHYRRQHPHLDGLLDELLWNIG